MLSATLERGSLANFHEPPSPLEIARATPPHPPMKRLLVAAIVLLAIGAVAWFQPWSATGPVGSNIPTWKLERQELRRTVRAIGLIAAKESRILSAPFSGKIAKLIPEGTYVEKDTPVVWMDTTELDKEATEAEVSFQLAQTEVTRAEEELQLLEVQQKLDVQSKQAQAEFSKVALQDAERKLEEQKVLVDRQLAARSTLDSEQLNVLQSKLNLREAEIEIARTEENQSSDRRLKQVAIDKAKVELAKEEDRLKEANDRMEAATLKAPTPGYITILFTWRGRRARIVEGDQMWEGGGIVEIPNPATIMARAPINELDINQVELDQPVSIRIPALPNEIFRGKVSTKGSVPITQQSGLNFINQAEGIKLFEVGAALDAQDPRFRQNMTAHMEIETGVAPNALVAPLDAVFGLAISNDEGASDFAGFDGAGGGEFPGPKGDGPGLGSDRSSAEGASAESASPEKKGGDEKSKADTPTENANENGENGERSGHKKSDKGSTRKAGTWYVYVSKGLLGYEKVPVALGLQNDDLVALERPDDAPDPWLAEGDEILMRDPTLPVANVVKD